MSDHGESSGAESIDLRMSDEWEGRLRKIEVAIDNRNAIEPADRRFLNELMQVAERERQRDLTIMSGGGEQRVGPNMGEILGRVDAAKKKLDERDKLAGDVSL